MNSSPVTDWSSVGAYYSFAGDISMLSLWFWLAVVLCALPLLAAIRHENETAERYRNDPADDVELHHKTGVSE